VKVRLSTVATPEMILAEKPDEVILAVGGNYNFPDVPGIQRWNVQGVKTLSKLAGLPLRIFGPDLLSKLTHLMLPIGRSITIMGGQIEAVQGAVFLAKRGKKVTIVEQTANLGQGIPPRYLERALDWLRKKNVRIITEAAYDKVSSEGLHITLKDGAREIIKSHSIMVLGRQTPNTDLLGALENKVKVRSIGSANGAESSLIVNAIHEGRRAGVTV
jgi:2,4-dienoyl-CoA reductase (NADPH2)